MVPATLLGTALGSARCRIARTSELRAARMGLLMEGMSEILAGTNPRALRHKLTAVVPPSELRLTVA